MARVQKLRLETLRDLDLGVLAAQFNGELARVVEDVADRPGLKKPRRIVLQVDVEPSERQGMAEVRFRVKATVPPLDSGYSMALLPGGQMAFAFAERTADELPKGADEV